MLLWDILTDFFPLIILYVNRVKRHTLAIPIMGVDHCTSCGIAVDGVNVCEICSQPSTSGDASTAETETPMGMYCQLQLTDHIVFN